MSRKFLWISVCGGVLLGTYLLGVVIFSGHCGFRTYVNGKSVFMMSADEIVLDINKSVQCQMLTLKRRDGTSEKIWLLILVRIVFYGLHICFIVQIII